VNRRNFIKAAIGSSVVFFIPKALYATTNEPQYEQELVDFMEARTHHVTIQRDGYSFHVKADKLARMSEMFDGFYSVYWFDGNEGITLVGSTSFYQRFSTSDERYFGSPTDIRERHKFIETMFKEARPWINGTTNERILFQKMVEEGVRVQHDSSF
jgi:hypothetical protein